MSAVKNQKFATLAVHAGSEPDPATGAVVTPIYAVSTFVQEAPNVNKGFDYGRSQNPTRFAFERAFAALESASAGFAFASGMAATSAVLATLPANSHVIASSDIYGGTYRLFEKVLKHSTGLEVTYANPCDLAALDAARKPNTKLVWLESITNPLMQVPDLPAIAAWAKKNKLLTAVDNTFASPWLLRPLEHGIDFVMHSATKYIGGHSDLIGGAVAAVDKELSAQIGYLQNATGGIASAFDSFLMLRGLRTLDVRMKRHCENALLLAEFLAKHPAIERVWYPGLPGHPQHAIARRLLGGKGYGGMISVVVKGGKEKALKFMQSTKLFTLAISLGGVESLIEHPATMTHATIPAETRKKHGIEDGLVRLSAGIEDGEDLRDDLAQALERL